MKNLESWVKENKVTAFVVGIIVVLVVFYLMKAAKEKEKRDERNEILDNSINVSNGGTASFNPKPFAEALKNDFEAYFSDPELYKKLLDLSDDQVRAVWADYDARIKSMANNPQKGKTLALALFDSYYWSRQGLGWPGGLTVWRQYAGKFHEKLESLNLPYTG